MKINRFINFILLTILIVISYSCSKNEPVDVSGKDTLEISFDYGTDLSPTAYKNIYVVWIQNADQSFIQNLKVCKKLISGGLTGTALPYWKTKIYPNSQSTEVDAVSSATIANSNFTITSVIKNIDIKQFTVYLETDRSFDSNDWFSDQPALLYSAIVDLESNVSEYELTPCGWTPNENTQNIINNTPIGILQKDLRYITNLKNGATFGGNDSRSATSMVEKIILKIK
jgi:hypothetical protein